MRVGVWLRRRGRGGNMLKGGNLGRGLRSWSSGNGMEWNGMCVLLVFFWRKGSIYLECNFGKVELSRYRVYIFEEILF